jgi:hypothetical protein
MISVRVLADVPEADRPTVMVQRTDGPSFQAKLKAIEAWALEVEQEALLPAIADQIKGQISSELERQTLGSIVDSLMNQVRTLMREIILSSQEVDTLLGSSLCT